LRALLGLIVVSKRLKPVRAGFPLYIGQFTVAGALLLDCAAQNVAQKSETEIAIRPKTLIASSYGRLRLICG
jgi:hypothetical protein